MRGCPCGTGGGGLWDIKGLRGRVKGVAGVGENASIEKSYTNTDHPCCDSLKQAKTKYVQ